MGLRWNPQTNTMEDDGAGINGLLGAVLGKQLDKTGSVTSDTTGTSDTTQTSGTKTAQTGTSLSDTTQDATSSTRGFTDQTQKQTGLTDTTSQSTAKTFGTVNTTGSSNTSFSNMQKTDADVSALREVYAKQAAGITPEMLAAIFQQGSKAAPQLAVAQANALGARGVGNTPVAVALNQLNADLTSKAADLNRSYLADSGATAARIADLTKSILSSGSSSTSSDQTQTQDLTTDTVTHSLARNIIDSVLGSTTGSDMTSTGTSKTAGSTTATGTSDTIANTLAKIGQSTTQTSKETDRTTINTNVAKSLAGMFAAGVGINELFKIAQNSGFVGSIKELYKQLTGQGAPDTGDETERLLTRYPAPDPFQGMVDNAQVDNTQYGDDVTNLLDLYNSIGVDVNLPDFFTGDGAFADGGLVEATKLPEVPNLLMSLARDDKEDADVDGFVQSLLGGKVSASAAPTVKKTAASKSTSSDGTATEDTGRSWESEEGATARIPDSVPSWANDYTPAKEATYDEWGGEDTAANEEMFSGIDPASDNIRVTFNKEGKVVSREKIDDSFLGGFVAPVLQSPIGMALMPYLGTAFGGGMQGAMAAGATTGGISAAAGDGDILSGILKGAAMGGAGSAFGAGPGQFDVATALGLDPGALGTFVNRSAGTLAKSAISGRDPTLALLNNIVPAMKTPSGKADGGLIDDESKETDEHESTEDISELLAEALGVEAADDGVRIPNKSLKLFVHALGGSQATRSYTPPASARADGGLITGPGTGISDSISATGPAGKPLRVANGEYILSKDVVDKVGVQNLDLLQAVLHTPASMQRAMGAR